MINYPPPLAPGGETQSGATSACRYGRSPAILFFLSLSLYTCRFWRVWTSWVVLSKRKRETSWGGAYVYQGQRELYLIFRRYYMKINYISLECYRHNKGNYPKYYLAILNQLALLRSTLRPPSDSDYSDDFP